jgi:glycosyltransferase involved in cell wall biosynthesis
MRVLLFTDTLGDVNGVSRFIRNVADQAFARGIELHAITSTRFECPAQANIHNPRPLFARAMPKYPQLEIVVPPTRRLHDLADRLKPDVVHVSTPGPVGVAGRRWARKRGVPLVGTYHTDFPAYIEHLFEDPVFTWTCTQTMRWFYRPFSRIFTRSADYGAALERMGMASDRIVRLLPGIDTDTFHTRYHDAGGGVWAACPGVRASSVKVLYVGRVSVEKNLPMLTRIWPRVHAACRRRGLDAQLLVVGDGPYREKMHAELAAAGADACFLGFRHGVELSTIYASSDIFVFPSTTDTLGQVVMEAQSAGLPVLVTDQGGPSEVVDDGRTGFVLPADNGATERWVQTLLRIIENPDSRRTMGAAGHAKIQPMSIRHSFEHFWHVHEQVAGKGAH